jgi:preprotein translocase subunit SecY
MWQKLVQAWKIKEVRNSLLFVGAMMVLFRFLANIPLPGIDVAALRQYLETNQALGMINLFSGGTLSNFSVVAMGVAPFITSSIIFQLLGMIIPKVEEIQKDGEAGRQRINQWSRIATVPLAILQGFGVLSMLRSSSMHILTRTDILYYVVILSTITAGTMFLMWMGEMMNERKVGNGLSLLIFAGIVSGLPTSLQRMLVSTTGNGMATWIGYGIVAIITVFGVVFITEAQRNIPIQYARQVHGSGGGVASALPLRVLMAGVIPIIFAVSMLMIPTMVAQFLLTAKSAWLASASRWVLATFQDQTFYGVFYFVLVVLFTYFYTSVIFKPTEIAENLQKQGGFVPGIRPGQPTADYIQGVITRVTFAGALFLGAIAVMPLILKGFSGTNTVSIGGTSLLIIVSVVIEAMKQIESHVSMREYDAY